MLEPTIRPCTSPFYTPVLLVKKTDMSWHFCIDYHTLNIKTSKDKFPIPMINELHGTPFFTKLDLRSSYHQVYMHLEDVKTVFCTDHRHFEFLVMPFSLSNKLMTFQALMNRSFLCRFVLVFFDDILIHCSSWSKHLQHVHLVLNALCTHDLQLSSRIFPLVHVPSPTSATSSPPMGPQWTERRSTLSPPSQCHAQLEDYAGSRASPVTNESSSATSGGLLRP